MRLFIGAKCAVRLAATVSFVIAASPVTGQTKSEDVGEAVYMRGCVTCHGDDGAGAMPGIPDLSGASGPLKKPDAELLSSIMNGFESGAAPMPMPSKGGDDALTTSEAQLVIDYMRRVFQ